MDANEQRKKLDEILKYAAARNIPVSADIILEVVKQDIAKAVDKSEAGINALLDKRIAEVWEMIRALEKVPNLWRADALEGIIPPDQLPIFDLDNPGAVPPSKDPRLFLGGDGWKPLPKQQPAIYGGGRGPAGADGVDGAPGPNTVSTTTTTNITGILQGNGATVEAATPGVDYAPALGADDNYVTDAEKAALHPAVTLDADADTLLELATQTLGLNTQDAAKVLAGPISGADAIPTFRPIEETDLPASMATEAWVQAQIAGLGSGSIVGTFLVGGGGVTWKTGYTFTVSAGSGYIDGVFITWAQQDIALDPADVTNDRIDVIAVDSGGTVIKITGAADPNPSEPVTDPSLQLKLAFVFVTHNTSSPPSLTSELLYADNVGSPTEWNWTTSGVGFNVASVNNPRTGTKDIEGTTVAANAYALATRGTGTIDPNLYTQLVLYIRFKSSWNASRYLQIQLQNAGVKKGNALRISNGQFGLDGTNTTTYQAVIIPMLLFAVPSGTLVNQLRIIDVGGSIGFYIDDITITTGGVGGTVIIGLTQDQADARYIQLSQMALTVATPGVDTKVPTEQAVREAIQAIVWPITKTVSNPQQVYIQRPQIALFQAPAALHIIRIHIHGNDSTPTSELAGDFKKADDLFTGSFANSAVIVAGDTTNGVFTDTNSYAVAANKYVYFQLDASPHADWVDFYIDIHYTLD